MLRVASELGYTLARLSAEITLEELVLWDAFFSLQNDEMEAARRRR